MAYGFATENIDRIELDLHRHTKGQYCLFNEGSWPVCRRCS